MSDISYLVMGLGILFAIVGVILFIIKGSDGQNTLKFLGMEFKLSGSSLVLFVIGVVMLILPLAKKEWFPPYPPKGSMSVDTVSTEKNIDNGTAEKAEQLIIKGDALWANGRFEDVDLAETYYSQAIELVNTCDRAIAQRAQTRIQKQQYIPATEDIKKAISINPDTGAYYAILARIYLSRGDTSTACEEWKKAYQNNYTKQKKYVALFCEDLETEDAQSNQTDRESDREPDISASPWVVRCDFNDGGQAFINRNNEIYMNYLEQLIPVGKKIPSSNPQFIWIYWIQTGTYLDLYNNLMGTNQYGVDGNGIIWGQSAYGFAQVGRVQQL